MRKFLVTGNMGYVGPGVIAELVRSHPDARIVGIDTGYFGHCLTNSKFLPESLLSKQIFKDIRSVGIDDLRGFDTVIHLAAISNDPMGNAFERPTWSINSEATAALAVAAKAAGVSRFVFASSCSIYGAGSDEARTEGAKTEPLTAYARSKLFVEEHLSEIASPDFLVSSLRFATACGWSPRLRLDLVLNDFVASAVTTGKIVVLSDGSPWRPLIHVDDMARALQWAGSRDVKEGGHLLIVNVGRDDWNFQVRDLAQAVAEIIPGTEVSINHAAAADRRSYRVDFGLLGKVAPENLVRVSLTDAVKDLADNVGSMSLNGLEFRQSSYIRLNELQRQIETGALDRDLHWTAMRGLGES